MTGIFVNPGSGSTVEIPAVWTNLGAGNVQLRYMHTASGKRWANRRVYLNIVAGSAISYAADKSGTALSYCASGSQGSVAGSLVYSGGTNMMRDFAVPVGFWMYATSGGLCRFQFTFGVTITAAEITAVKITTNNGNSVEFPFSAFTYVAGGGNAYYYSPTFTLGTFMSATSVTLSITGGTRV